MFTVFIVLAGVFNVIYPAINLWDFVNYHYYNPWAFFHDRLGYDIAPAMIHTYFNPLIDVPYYLMLNAWGSGKMGVVLFCQGAYFGILLFVFYKIIGLFFDFKKQPIAVIVTFLISATGFAAYSQWGTCSNEIQVSILILWGLYLILKHISDENRKKSVWIWSGLLMGAALGLKPTMITYCLGAGLSLIIFCRRLKVSFREITLFATSGLAGYLLVNGWWMIKLYHLFDNPFFPFLNGIFKSEYFDTVNFRDDSFVTMTTWWQKIISPLIISFCSLEINYFSSAYFFDLRYALGFIVLLVMFVRWLIGRRGYPENKYILLYAFIVISYIIWMNSFSIIRYVIPIEMLTAIIIVKFFDNWKINNFIARAVLISFAIIGAYILVAEIPDYLTSWGNCENPMYVEPVNLPDDVIVETYAYPTAMVAALLVGNHHNRIVSYADWISGVLLDFVEKGKFRQKRDDIIRNHSGLKIALIPYEMQNSETRSVFFARMRRVALERKGMYCRALHTYLDFMDICVPQELKDDIFIEEEWNRNEAIAKHKDKKIRDVKYIFDGKIDHYFDNFEAFVKKQKERK